MRLIAAVLFAVCTLAAQPPASLVKSHFTGVWKLVSCESRSPAGELAKPYGDKPQGRLVYEADGHVSLQIMRPGNRFRLITRASLPTENNKDDFSEAWFGTWDVFARAEIHKAILGEQSTMDTLNNMAAKWEELKAQG